MWTRFMDMHSGGGTKEDPYQYIYIEAPESEAVSVFYNRFSHNPHRVTCTCCGEDYSVSENESLEQLTAFGRGCAYEGNAYVERQNEKFKWSTYCTLDEYKKKADVLFICADEIQAEERTGVVPEQGYIWKG